MAAVGVTTATEAAVGVAAVAWLCWPRGVFSTGIDCRDAPNEAWGGLDSFTEDSTTDSRDEVEYRSSITWKCDVYMKFTHMQL